MITEIVSYPTIFYLSKYWVSAYTLGHSRGILSTNFYPHFLVFEGILRAPLGYFETAEVAYPTPRRQNSVTSQPIFKIKIRLQTLNTE